MPNYLLGINCYGHDTSVALLSDGNVIAAIEEERLSRVKKTRQFPLLSIQHCLNEANITLSELQGVCYAYDPSLWYKDRILRYWLKYPQNIRYDIKSIQRQSLFVFQLKSRLRKDMGLPEGVPIYLVKHHDAHLASSYYCSNFHRAAAISIDGLGESESVVAGFCDDNKILNRKTYGRYPNSLGIFYSAFTYFCGFTAGHDEGKLMGLAPYGDPHRYFDVINKLIYVKDNGNLKVNLDWFSYHRQRNTWVSNKLIHHLGLKPRHPKTDLTQDYKDIAASAQSVLENCILKIVTNTLESYNVSKLCLAGGVSLNSVANGRIQDLSQVQDLFIQPAAGDNGLPIGAAQYVYHNLWGNEKISHTRHQTFFGPKYSNKRCEYALISKNCVYTDIPSNNSRALKVAQELANGKIVALFQGRMEFGPRALGNRSILANPLLADCKDKLNAKVKLREGFRPFAPAVLEEDCSEIFNLTVDSPHMLLISQVKDRYRKILPGITHVDNSARIQTVVEDENPFFYQVLKHFKSITGYGVLVNTSFNIKDEPIVCTPENAIDCFMGTGIDYLCIEEYLLDKSSQPILKKVPSTYFRFNKLAHS